MTVRVLVVVAVRVLIIVAVRVLIVMAVRVLIVMAVRVLIVVSAINGWQGDEVVSGTADTRVLSFSL